MQENLTTVIILGYISWQVYTHIQSGKIASQYSKGKLPHSSSELRLVGYIRLDSSLK